MKWTYTDLMAWDDSNENIPNVVNLDISHNGLTNFILKSIQR
jgi:hypothetical protein